MIGFFGLNSHIAIDLGTSTTKVYVRGKGVIADEPTVAAVKRATGEIWAVGERARKMEGKAPPEIEVVFPVRDGVISDFDLVEKLIRYYIRLAYGPMRIFKPVVVVSVPCVMTDVEARAVVEAAGLAGARKVYLLREPFAVALGSDADVSSPRGIMVIDMGGGTSDYAVMSLSGISVLQSVRVAGNLFDEEIVKYIGKNFGLVIGNQTAERVKRELGTAFIGRSDKKSTVKGRDYMSGLPRSITVSADMICEAISDELAIIADNAKSVLERTPPELVADIFTDGILLSGGGSMIDGLDEYLAQKLGTPVHRVPDPQYAVINGEAAALEQLDNMAEGLYGMKMNRF
ncbi:MAG: rod shape-determining protein [Clostridia bacterium]|nr:rod shape-determining protein [Clostridia bacterium]